MKIFTFEQFTNESLIKESHFKVGDKVRMSHGGEGIIVSLDKEDGADDEAYYNIELPNGDMMKHAPNELEKVNEASTDDPVFSFNSLTFDEIKDKFIKNPYGIGAQSVEFVEGERGNSNKLIFRHGDKSRRDQIISRLKALGIPTKKLTKFFNRALKYPYELILRESVLNEASTEEMIKKEAISRLSDFFRISPNALSKFNFDGKDNVKDLTKALNSTSDQGSKLYYEMAIKLAKEEIGVDESHSLNENKLVDETTGKEVKLPYTTKDFRGDKIVVVGFTPPKHSGSSGRILTSGGREFFPGVAGLKIVT